MTAETLPGFRLEAHPMTLEEDYEQYAVRIIERVKLSFVEDRDKILVALNRGGTFLEMRAAVDAYWVINETINGLELAIDRALGNDDGEGGE